MGKTKTTVAESDDDLVLPSDDSSSKSSCMLSDISDDELVVRRAGRDDDGNAKMMIMMMMVVMMMMRMIMMMRMVMMAMMMMMQLVQPYGPRGLPSTPMLQHVVSCAWLRPYYNNGLVIRRRVNKSCQSDKRVRVPRGHPRHIAPRESRPSQAAATPRADP